MTEKSKTYFAFIKIGKEKHIDELQLEGHLYCNTLRYYRKLEEKKVRGDQHEGRGLIKQAKRLDLVIENKIVGTSFSAQLYADEPKLIGNIFCLYGFESKKLDYSSYELQEMVIEDSNKGFGDFALVIHNPKEFKDRLQSFLSKNSIPFEFEPVYYYDPLTTDAKIDQYCKSNIYSYQNEVRLWLPNNTEEPRSIRIGNLSDISVKLPINDLDKLRVKFIEQ